MPNWCTTNYRVRGKEAELKEFAGLVNSLPSKAQVARNGFGPFWLGNFVAALGENWKSYSVRGVIDPDPDADACFFGPDPDADAQVEIVNGQMLGFSITTAWSHMYDLDDLLRSKFPSFQLFWIATDEFGSFNIVNDPDDVVGFERYCIEAPGESLWFSFGQKDEFLKELREMIPDLVVPDDITDSKESLEKFSKRFCEWRDADKEGRERLGFRVFLQV